MNITSFGAGLASTRGCRSVLLFSGALAVGWEETAAAGFGEASTGASTAVPSTTMLVPQCLQVMRTFFPRTFSSGTAYFAGHPVQVTFIAYVQRSQMWRLESPKR